VMTTHDRTSAHVTCLAGPPVKLDRLPARTKGDGTWLSRQESAAAIKLLARCRA